MKNIFVTKEICIGTADSKTCLTKEKIDQLLLLQTTMSAGAQGGSSNSGNSGGNTTTPPPEDNGTTTPDTSTSTPDTTAPIITITGTNPLTIILNETYTEEGATALDDVDGTVPVISTGAVDTSTAGTYTIIYSATDIAGNTATSTREVIVQ